MMDPADFDWGVTAEELAARLAEADGTGRGQVRPVVEIVRP